MVVQMLELIHSYLTGNIHTPSYGKSRYVLTFIDDFSRYCCVYFLKQKSEVFEIFKVFKFVVENLSGKNIKVLTTNNGNKYVNKKLQHICVYNVIQIQHFVPYTPQQNGVAKHTNRALKEMATCMLEDKYLSHNLWDEAINCSE